MEGTGVVGVVSLYFNLYTKERKKEDVCMFSSPYI